jgi:hypothetical protein
MKKTHIRIVVLCILFLGAAVSLQARTLRIITPYVGALTNKYADDEYMLDLKDTALLTGLYLQWINTEKFQVNFFIYQSSDINYSNIWGFHFLFDYYFGVQENRKNTIGVGTEYISVNMTAGDAFTPLSNFNLENDVWAPFVRVGRYFYFGSPERVRSYFLPWLGLEYDIVRGNVGFTMPNPAPPPPPSFDISEPIKDENFYGLVGLKFKTVIYHFVDIELKSSFAFNNDEFLTRLAAMANLYLGRHWGLSYRFLYTETMSGSNLYNIGGIAILF